MKLLRWTFDSLVASTDPANWNDFVPTFTRNKEYRSIISSVSGNALRLIKDAKDYVDAARDSLFIKAVTTILLERYNANTRQYENYLEGKVDYTQYKKQRTITEVGFSPQGFIQDWLRNDKVTLNLQDLTDIHEGAITPFTSETQEITLTDQLIDKELRLDTDVNSGNKTHIESGPVTNIFKDFQIALNEETVNELDIEFNTFDVDFVDDIENAIQFREAGQVVVTGQIVLDYDIETSTTASGEQVSSELRVFIKHRSIGSTVIDTEEIADFSASDLDIVQISGSDVVINVDYTLTAAVGDRLEFYATAAGDQDTGGAATLDVDFSIQQKSTSELKIIQKTEFRETTVKTMLPWEAFLRICQKLTGRNDCFRSKIFGRTDGEVHQYASNGDFALYALTTGQLVRGFDIADKPMTMSFNQLFKDMDAMVGPLAAGIIYEGGLPYIAVDHVSEFHKIDTFLFDISNYEIRSFSEETKQDAIFNQVITGYKKWESEQFGLLDSTHTQRTYKTEINEISQDYSAESSTIAAGPTIELVRRERDTGKDNRYDKDLFIIELIDDSGLRPLIGSDLPASPTGMNNPLQAYNYSLTPVRIAKRHSVWFKNGFTDAVLTFQSSKGNDQVSSRTASDISPLDEDQDLVDSESNNELQNPIRKANTVKLTFPITRENIAKLIEDPHGYVTVDQDKKYYIEDMKVESTYNNTVSAELTEAYE